MESKSQKIWEYVTGIFNDSLARERNKYIANDYSHIIGVSCFCGLFAVKRKLDPELANIIGMLHDVYRLKTGVDEYHSASGAEMCRVALRGMDFLSVDEKRIILSAIFHHSDKAHVHREYDELIKDADLLQSFLYSGGKRAHVSCLTRLEKLSLEMNLPIDFDLVEVYGSKDQARQTIDKRNLLADTAEKLAAGTVTGSREDAAYMNLIRYWPEDSAFDELKNGWCAAFVYHCCREAGFHFPIKWNPHDKLRFACVAAWNTWAREPGRDYFINDAPGFIPERGDIVLYRNSIPPENKPEEQRDVPIDHIGIVLGTGNGEFTVAEGNVNNENSSGILTKPLHRNIEGFIRIGNDLVYDGWKNDYQA